MLRMRGGAWPVAEIPAGCGNQLSFGANDPVNALQGAVVTTDVEKSPPYLPDRARTALGLTPSGPHYFFYRHRAWVRVAHWVNALCLAILLMSGLNIFNAHPTLYWGDGSNFQRPLLTLGAYADEFGMVDRGVTAIGGHEFSTTGVLGASKIDGQLTARGFPSWATLPRPNWLAMARQWHFAFAWILVLNAIGFIAYGLWSRHFIRDLAPTRRDIAHLGREIADHARLKFPRAVPPPPKPKTVTATPSPQAEAESAKPDEPPPPTPTSIDPEAQKQSEDEPDEVKLTAPVIHLGDQEGAVLADFKYGAGRVIFLSDPFALANNGIARGANLQLALNLVNALLQPDQLIYFDEYHHGFRSEENALVRYFRGTPFWWVMGQLLLLGLVLVPHLGPTGAALASSSGYFLAIAGAYAVFLKHAGLPLKALWTPSLTRPPEGV